MTQLRVISSEQARRVRPVAPSQDTPFCVTAIGSCRIVGPLRIMQQTPEMVLNQSGVYGYSHASTELRQHLAHLMDQTRPPTELLPLVAKASDASTRPQGPHRRSDFYVFELSSAKQVSVAGHPVQLNYLNRYFRTFFSDTARTRTFWTHAKHARQSDMTRFLADLPEYRALSAQDQKLLREVRLEMATPAQLRRDIDAIKTAAPDHLFVTHFDATSADGTPLKARAAYLKMVRDALTDCNAVWYDPSPSVQAFGQSVAVEDPKASLSHYSHAFEQYLCSDWWMRFIDPVRQRNRLAASTKARIREKAMAQAAQHAPSPSSLEKV